MHEHGYFHRDLKPENMILIDEQNIRLIDFGTCIRIDKIKTKEKFNDYVSTRWYRAPEWILKFHKYDEKVDVFAIGCIMAELYRMAPIFWGKNSLDQLRIYCYALGSPKKSEWPEAYKKAAELSFEFPNLKSKSIESKVPNASQEAVELMDMMLQMNPKDRPSVSDILNHPYFDEVDEDSPEILNPFTSPLKSSDRRNNDPEINVFSEAPGFGWASKVPIFGSSKKAEYDADEFMGDMATSSSAKKESTKKSYSFDKANYLKKSKSQVVDDKKYENFSGFGTSAFGDLVKQKERKNSNHMIIDDEITDISNNQNWFAAAEEDLPAFGSLLNNYNKEDANRRKSQYVSSSSAFGDLTAFASEESNNKSITHKYMKKDSFGAFGSSSVFPSFGTSMAKDSSMSEQKPSEKLKPKVSIWEDDELMFAVAQNDNTK